VHPDHKQYTCTPNLCVTLTQEDPRGDIAARVVFSGIGSRGESGNGVGKYKTSYAPKFLDGVRAVEEAEKDWRHSKGSASHSATIRSLESTESHFILRAFQTHPRWLSKLLGDVTAVEEVGMD